jgi:hypothetical protein
MDRPGTLKVSSRIIAVYIGPVYGRADRSCESEVLPHESNLAFRPPRGHRILDRSPQSQFCPAR